MKPFTRLLLACFAIFLFSLDLPPALAQTVRLFGAGATLPVPIYAEWFRQFNHEHPNVQVDYQGMRSGAGIQSFIDGRIDFGGSDGAMSDDHIGKVDGGVVLIPITAGAIVLGYNLPGVPKGLKLPRDVYPDIFLGRIARWNDPRIATANPDLTLPDLPITVVTRFDASGTDYVFTKHLAAISSAFAKEIGSGIDATWPSANPFVSRARNEGVTVAIQRTPGAIGYLESSFGRFVDLTTAALQNKAGHYVQATAESGKAALASAKLDDHLRGGVDDPEGAESYPIVTFTWLLFRKKTGEPKAAVARDLVAFCASEPRQAEAEQLGYIPLPANVIDKIKAAIPEIQ